MSSRVQHKESLPGQGHIKRRRGPGVDPRPVDGDEGKQEAQQLDRSGSGEADEKEIGRDKDITRDATEAEGDQRGKRERKEEDGDKPSLSSSSSSSDSSSSSGEDEDDADAIARETARLAQLRGRATSGTASPSAAKASGSYNHDVLFRRSDWRKTNASAASAAVVSSSGAQVSEKKKWRLVVNNKEESANYQHFMKKHFK